MIKVYSSYALILAIYKCKKFVKKGTGMLSKTILLYDKLFFNLSTTILWLPYDLKLLAPKLR